MNKKTIFGLLIVFLASAVQVQANPAKIKILEKRVTALEEYAETIQPTFTEFSEKLNTSIQTYTRSLEQSLASYALEMQDSLDTRFKGLDEHIVVLDVNSQSYRKIETNSGYFLIAVQKVEQTKQGFRLFLQVGNPHYANFKGVKIILTWGNRWVEGAQSFEEWRSSLMRAEFQYDGSLQKSAWNPVTIDLPASDGNQLGYVECEMLVSSIELQPAN